MARIPSSSLPALALLATGALLVATAPASAQVCQEGAKLIRERQTIVQQLNKAGGKDKKLDPRMACGAFGKLVANGEQSLKWLETNKDWCQIPDDVAQNLKQEHDKVKDIRTQACQAAAKFEQMQKQARQQQQQQQQGGNPFAGGLTGQYKIPQGAL
jgi:hypothetical protein